MNDFEGEFNGWAMRIVIYHNPQCSKSRATLDLLRQRGVEPEVIEYLKQPPSVGELKNILAMLGARPRELLRPKEGREAGLDDAALSDDEIIAGMARNPVTIERPIVVAGDQARLGRPPERVLEII
jgi:arsenate reductase (glutaredoxin)